MESLKRQAAKLLGEQKKYRRWIAVFLCLAVVVTASTVAALKMNGQALSRKERKLVCGMEVHKHTEECYEADPATGEKKLICGYADYVVHTHNADCWGEDGELVCKLPEIEVHTHDESCFQEEKVLICGQEESAGHVHTEACRKLVCGQEESAGHVHTEACRTLVCGQEESIGHVHTDACKTVSRGALICTNTEEGHEHTDECYEKIETITCGMEEGEGSHTHTEECWDPHGCGLEDGAMAHTHTEECWNPEGCGLKEGEGSHTHTPECYEIIKTAICGKLELHTHVKTGEDSCYDEEGNLICGIPELKEHVHGEGCFEIVEEEAEEPESDASAESTENSDENPENGQESGEAVESTEESGESEEGTEGAGESEESTEESGETVEGSEESDESVSEEAAESGKTEESVQGVAGVLTAEGSDYTVTATFGEDAGIPEGAQLTVREVEQGSEEYEIYYQQMLEAIAGESDETSEDVMDPEAENADTEEPDQENDDTEEEVEVSFARLFDISFVVNGEKIEPVAGASVDIRISYRDAVECGEGDTASAVHFAKDGTEVLEADVVESGEGSDFVFTQDSFSMTFSIMTKAPNKGGELTPVKGDGYTITVEYGRKSSITKDNAELVVEEIKDNEQEGTGNNSYRKYLDNSEGAIKEKTNNKDKEHKAKEAASRVFRVSVVDKKSRQPLDTEEVKVTISYDKAVSVNEAGIAAMVLNTEDSGTVLDSVEVSEGQSVRTFSGTMSFSAAEPRVLAAMVTEIMPYGNESGGSGDNSENPAIVHTPVAEYLTKVNEANKWQIVDQGYEGNSPENKWPKPTDRTGNESVLVQKNVIPAGVENEFYVYLSIDMKEIYKKYFEAASYFATTSKGYDQSEVGKKVKWKGTPIDVSSEDEYDGGGSGLFIVKDEDENILANNVRLYWSQATNVSILMKLSSGDWILCGTDIKDEGPHTIRLSKAILDELEKELSQKVTLGTVTDTMGDNITFLKIEGGDYKKDSTGINGDTLTWTPVPKKNAERESTGTEDDKTTWVRNVSELVYKVRLNVTADRSCAEHVEADGKECLKDGHEYKVNNTASLSYDSEISGKSETIDFQVPYVRGTLYDIKLQKNKADKDGTSLNEGLGGAKFRATDKEDNTKTYDADSDSSGAVKFTGLPHGTYTVTEVEAPEEYEKDELWSQEFTLCYTGDHEGSGELISNPDNKKDMILKANSDLPTVINNKKKLKVKLVKAWDTDVQGDEQLESVIFGIQYTYKAIKKNQDGTVSKDEDFNVIYETLNDKIEVTLEKSKGWNAIIYLPSTAEINSVTEKSDDGNGNSLLGQFEVMKPKKDGSVIIKGDAVFTPGTGTEPNKEPDTYTITNQYKKYPIEILKVQKGTTTPVSGAVFDLYDEDPTGENAKPMNGMTGLKSGTDGVITKADGSQLKLRPHEYWLVETNPPEGYLMREEPYYFIVNEEATEIQSFNVENELAEIDLQILKKKDGATEYLSGAEFDVTYAPSYEGGKSESCKWKSNGEGIICVVGEDDNGDETLTPVTKLGVGTWTVRETKAPDGYNLPSGSFTITVSPSTDSGDEIKISNMSYCTAGKVNGRWEISILNNPGVMLPETGGPGTTMYTLGGFAVIAASLMYGLSMRRKKQKGGSN